MTKIKYYVVGQTVFESSKDDEYFCIKNCKNRSEAEGLRNHLNSGGGFAGWTPQFMQIILRP